MKTWCELLGIDALAQEAVLLDGGALVEDK